MKMKGSLLFVLLVLFSSAIKAEERFSCYDVLYKRYERSYDQEWFLKIMASRVYDQFAFVKDGWMVKDKKPSEVQTTRIGRFFYALARAELLWTTGVAIEKDLPDSLSRLEALIKEDPSNAIFYAYKAVVENQLGKPEAAKATLAEMNTAAREYNSYYLNWNRNLIKSFSKNIEEYLGSVMFISAMPRPDFSEIGKLAKKLNVNLERLGRFMVKEGLEAKEEDSYSTWDALEYSIGRELISKVRKPGIPTLSDLFKKYPYTVSEIYLEMYSDPALCTDKAIDTYLENGRMDHLRKIE